MGTRYDCRTLTSPQCRTLEVLVPRVVFFDVVICCFRPLQISMDHVEVVTWKAWCPSFWALSKVPGTLVIGKCAILGVGFLRVCITLYGYLWHFYFSEHGSPKDKVSFLCVRRFMFTWAMDPGYEIIALAAQPPEPKHAKCINADQKEQDARYQSPMQQGVLKWYLPTHSTDSSSLGPWIWT